MSSIRYKPSRILVRSLCRLPGETKRTFTDKKRRIYKQFERFNIDVAEICQWLMSTRHKNNNNSTVMYCFWNFYLEPDLTNVPLDEKQQDRLRLAAMDQILGIRDCLIFDDNRIPDNIRKLIHTEVERSKTQNTIRLFERLKQLDGPHRLILLKSAAEWIIARYYRGHENWERQYEEWEKEKKEWETEHPELTVNTREAFTSVFKQLREDPAINGVHGIRRKNPRICPFDRLQQRINNCIYAGEKGHGPLCWKYTSFISQQKNKNNTIAKHFWENAENYLKIRKQLERPEVKNKLRTSPQQEAFNRLYQQKGMQAARHWFTAAWREYLNVMNLTEQTLLSRTGLPHCKKIGKTFEDSECQWNPHTELCQKYHQAVSLLPSEHQQLESQYREWRRDFLAGPRKPSFRYPSSKQLPLAKIFGKGFFEIDWDHSLLRLRLDDMQQGEWIELGFKPWPRSYKPEVKEVTVTSVHLNFAGSRARAGFRFEVMHQPSRFSCTQEELDELRSRHFPRQAQDQQFLETARKRLLESFTGQSSESLKMLAIDLGETGAYGSLYEGRKHIEDKPLEIIKIDQCYSQIPTSLSKDKEREPIPPFPLDKDRDWRGLRKEHVGHHLHQIKMGSSQLVNHRIKMGLPLQTLRNSDFSRLTRHIRWMIRDWARHNAAQIIRLAEKHKSDLIIFESLRGFKPRGYDIMEAEQKRRLAFFAFGQVRRRVVEKAVERGMRVITVPYGYSSHMCSACGHLQVNKKRWRKNKDERNFHCECGDSKSGIKAGNVESKHQRHLCSCSVQLNSDANAARVLGRVFWGEVILPAKNKKTE